MSAKQNSRDNVQAALESAEEKLQQAAEQVSSKTQELTAKTQALKEETSTAISHSVADVEAFVREKPLQAIGLAFAAGFVATVLLRRSR